MNMRRVLHCLGCHAFAGPPYRESMPTVSPHRVQPFTFLPHQIRHAVVAGRRANRTLAPRRLRPVYDAPGDWAGLNWAPVAGYRGLPGGVTLAQLLAEHGWGNLAPSGRGTRQARTATGEN
jgi:hypothetical protein